MSAPKALYPGYDGY